MSVLQQIAALEARRAEIYAGAAGRWLTPAECAQLHQLARALDAAWQLRRQQQARRPQADHELLLVREFRL